MNWEIITQEEKLMKTEFLIQRAEWRHDLLYIGRLQILFFLNYFPFQNAWSSNDNNGEDVSRQTIKPKCD